MNTDEIQAYKDKRAITDCLMRYSRGIDRCDTQLLKSVYHPDATDDHGIFAGNAWEFADFMATFDKELGVHQQSHSIDNVLIELTGADTAVSEAYHTTYVRAETPDGFMMSLIGGRYLDRWERRSGEWKIADRVYVMDWNMNQPSTAAWSEGIYGKMIRGEISMRDVSYETLPAGLFGEESHR